MKLDRFDLIVWLSLGVIGLALLGVLLVGDQADARIVGVTPEANGSPSANGRVGIEFAQDMDRASVESAFSLEPSIQGKFSWQEKQLWFAPEAPFARGITYMAKLKSGAVGAQGQKLKRDFVWQFSIRDPLVIYLTPSNGGELWSVAPGGDPKPLTNTGGRIYDFAVAPTGEQIAYTVVNESDGVDVWLMNRDGTAQHRAVDCAADRCTTPAWSPDGNRVAYSRANAGIAPGAPHGPPRVWILDIDAGQNSALYQDSQLLGYGPSWSPDGGRIAAWDGIAGGIRVYDFQTQEVIMLPSQMGLVGAWSPDGQTMLYNNLSIVAEQPVAKLYQANLQTKEVKVALESNQAVVDYSVPVWSPDGRWIAVGLKASTGGMGSQLWIMRPDGGESRPIATEPQYTYGAYRWDPWSQAILFQRFELGAPFAKPEILLWSFISNTTQPIAQDASLPAWLP